MATKVLYRIEKMLKEYSFLSKMIEQDKILLNEFSYLRAVDYDRVTVQGTNKFNSETENLMINRVDIESRLMVNSNKMMRIDAAMKLLDQVEVAIIKSYYFDGLSWEIISFKESMSIRQCQRVRDDALSKINLYIFAEKVDKRTGIVQMAMDILKV